MSAKSNRLNYEVVGAGTPIVFVHGFTGSLEIWKDQVSELSKYCKTVGLDLTGHGNSYKPDLTYTPSLFVNDIKTILGLTNVEKAILVGSSMGGFVVEQFCAEFPEKVLGMVLIGTRGKNTLNLEARVKESDSIGYVEHMKKRTERSFGKSAPRDLVEWTTGLRLKVPERIALKIQDAYRGYDPLSNLEKIKVPTLIIVGAEDAVTPPDEAEFIHKTISGSELHIVQGCGHHVMLEDSSTVNNLILDFLRRNHFVESESGA